MQEPDWLELWILNRTILMECSLHAIIIDVTKEHFGFWDFPEQPAVRAPVEQRIEVLSRCVSRGFVKIYTKTWLDEPQIGIDSPLSLKQCDFKNPGFLESSVVISTPSGHAYWESRFQPDWGRYWHTDGILDSSTDEAAVHVVYAGNDIYQELIQMLPDYLGADIGFGIKQIRCNTVFQYQVTKWKVLPFVKAATWKIKIDSTLNGLAEIAQGVGGDQESANFKTDVSNYFRELSARQLSARRTLGRLSDKWVVDSLGNGAAY